MWAGILPAQPPLAHPELSLCYPKGRFMRGLANLSSERKGLRNRCKPDPGLLFQLCAAGREGTAPLGAAAGALAEGGIQNTLHPSPALPSDSLLRQNSSFTQVNGAACSRVTSVQFFSIQKDRQQLGRTSCCDILPLNTCNNTKRFAHFVPSSLVPQGVN